MRRILTVIAAAGLAAALVASAATLGVEGGTIQAGEDLTLTCDDDGVQVLGWGLETSTDSVDRVRLGGISADCVGNDLWVAVTAAGVVTDGGPEALVAGNTGGNQAVVVFDSSVDPEDITELRIYIEGSEGS